MPTQVCRCLSPLLFLVVTTSCFGETFHVSTTGGDEPTRNGKSDQQAWASLAFACEQVPEGSHRIELAAGTFTATRTARPHSGVTIQGAGSDKTKLIAASDWKLRPEIGPEDDEGQNQEEYLIAIRPGEKITVRALELCSPTDHRITGGLFCRDGQQIVLEDLLVKDFRWNGLRVEFSQQVTIRRCVIQDCSSIKRQGSEGGHLRTRWIADSRIHNNRIESSDGSGYGYKAGGHERVRIDHNFIDTGYFAIESAHESEIGVEIDHNYLTRCISIPKPGQGEDPNKKGSPYSFWIHDNLLTDSYTIEGPRNHLRVSHNYIRIERPEGRVYTQHGGICNGPVSIDHNIIEGVDRGVVWMNEGLAEQMHVVHNTIFCDDVGDRSEVLFWSYSEERLNHWEIRNNVIVAAPSRPRTLSATERGVAAKMSVNGNVLVNLVDPLAGNTTSTKPDARSLGLHAAGNKPWAFYQPVAKGSLVDAGVPVDKPFWGEDFPFAGKAADVGAVESGMPLREWSIPSKTPEKDAE